MALQAALQPSSNAPASPMLEAAVSQAKPINRASAAAPWHARAESDPDIQFFMSMQADARAAEALARAEHTVRSHSVSDRVPHAQIVVLDVFSADPAKILRLN